MHYILSKEFAFSILLLSGTIKAVLPLIGVSGIPDLTLLSALMVTIIMVNHMRETLLSLPKNSFELILLLTLFYLFIIFSISYSSAMSSSITKTINFGTMALALFFPLLVKEFNIKLFIKILTITIFILSIIFLNFYTSYLNRDETLILSLGEEVAKQMTSLYLTVSWLNGILVLYYFFDKEQNPTIRWSVLVISFIFLISAGGRGPLLFTVVILGIYLLYQLFIMINTFLLNKLIVPILIMLFMTSSIIFLVSNVKLENYDKSLKLVDNTVARLMELVNTSDGGASAHSRIVNAKFSIKKINEHSFWGYGIGSYGYEKLGIDELDYPHNIFLEVWFELGYIPLIIFLLIFYRVFMMIDKDNSPWAVALFFFFLLNLLKSSSLIDTRMMFGFFALFSIAQDRKIIKG